MTTVLQVDMPLPQRSFEDAADGELASALTARISQLTSPEDEDEAPSEEVEEVPITGEELRTLVFAKYGE